MGSRKEVTSTVAARYEGSDQAARGAILGEVGDTTVGFAITPVKVVNPRPAPVQVQLETDCAAVIPFLRCSNPRPATTHLLELVPVLRRFKQVRGQQHDRGAGMAMVVATIDRVPAEDRKRWTSTAASPRNPARAQASDPDPHAGALGLGRRGAQFRRNDLVGDGGCIVMGDHAEALTVADSWTKNHGEPTKPATWWSQRWVRRGTSPSPDRVPLTKTMTMTKSVVDWASVGYLRYNTPAELVCSTAFGLCSPKNH
ncbi:MAG: hypothetical protein EON54_00455 [Alcaligenaceae bacterium]|nr:MAG: hypothetical protein EON54_00455 [Alcaligenaceae bacterium]